MSYRTEKDSMGEMQVPAERAWGAQTQRSYQNFKIGEEKMPQEIISAIAVVKKAAADANFALGKLSAEKADLIKSAAEEIISGKRREEFPLSVWQTGSGTQTNMNVNEVIANIGNGKAGKKLLHPNDDVNASQSSNDVFPSAIHIAGATAVTQKLLPAAFSLADAFKKLKEDNKGVIKTGRTHLMDAVPVSFSQEISGWEYLIREAADEIKLSLCKLYPLPLGGTAVGTGLNAPEGFSSLAVSRIAEYTGLSFTVSENKFQSLSAKDGVVFCHGAIKALACNLFKVATDIKWLSSGPRSGIGEINIPFNEPGSSIMPGKVNPTQCEAVSMVAAQVIGDDAAITFAATQGNFQLNTFMPVIAHNFLKSVNLLADAIKSFTDNCVKGITANRAKMRENLEKSLMTVTALSPIIGYENAAKTVKKAYDENVTLKEACIALGFITAEKFDEVFHPEEMAKE